MEGNGSGGATPWDLGINWAPSTSTSAYLQPSPPTSGPDHDQQPQPHLTCLKLGKRPCCWGGGGPAGQAVGGGPASVAGVGGGSGAVEVRKKEKAAAAAAAAAPRCQVEGCHVELVGAKEYHRRHKVCEPHSKAPRVVVLGVEQRFCQQCSRFHAIAEFDDAKRSCRRRLAGHNERRRKSSASEAMARGPAHLHGGTPVGHGLPYFPTTPAGALSLLSSRASPWLISTPDISARSSAALDELIAENRASVLAWQFFSDRSGRPAAAVGRGPDLGGWPLRSQLPPQPDHAGDGIGHYHETGGGHVTLDLIQATTSAPFRAVPDGPKPNDGGDGGCSDIWKSLEGARVV